MDDGEDVTGRQRKRTVAVMRSTVEQLQLASEIFGATATASPNPETTSRLQALADDVSAQAEDIRQRADRLAGGDCDSADRLAGGDCDSAGRLAGGDCGSARIG